MTCLCDGSTLVFRGGCPCITDGCHLLAGAVREAEDGPSTPADLPQS